MLTASSFFEDKLIGDLAARASMSIEPAIRYNNLRKNKNSNVVVSSGVNYASSSTHMNYVTHTDNSNTLLLRERDPFSTEISGSKFIFDMGVMLNKDKTFQNNQPRNYSTNRTVS